MVEADVGTMVGPRKRLAWWQTTCSEVVWAFGPEHQDLHLLQYFSTSCLVLVVTKDWPPAGASAGGEKTQGPFPCPQLLVHLDCPEDFTKQSFKWDGTCKRFLLCAPLRSHLNIRLSTIQTLDWIWCWGGSTCCWWDGWATRRLSLQLIKTVVVVLNKRLKFFIWNWLGSFQSWHLLQFKIQVFDGSENVSPLITLGVNLQFQIYVANIVGKDGDL